MFCARVSIMIIFSDRKIAFEFFISSLIKYYPTYVQWFYLLQNMLVFAIEFCNIGMSFWPLPRDWFSFLLRQLINFLKECDASNLRQCIHLKVCLVFRCAETSAKLENNSGRSVHAGLASLIPQKPEPSIPSTILGWRMRLASMLSRNAN